MPGEPESGIAYPQWLRASGRGPWTGVVGIPLGLVGFLVASAVVAQIVIGLGWVAQRESGEFADRAAYAAAAQRFETPVGLLAGNLSIASLILVAVVLVKYVHQAPVSSLWSVENRIRWGWFGLATAIAAVVFTVHVAVMPWTGELAPWRPQAGFWSFMIVVVLTTPLQAAAEEIFFRGYLMQAFGGLVRSPWWGIIGAALLFALFHGAQNPALFLSRFAFGVVVGWLVVHTGGLEAAIAAHIINNLLAWVLAAGTATIAEVRAITEVTWAQSFADVIVFSVITVVCALAGHRRGLKNRAASPQPA